MEKMEGVNVLMNKYEFGRLLGQGNFAKVYYGKNIKSGQTVAIKVIDKEKSLKVGLIDQIKREISVMRLVKHPNIIQLYEVMATQTKIYFVMEYAKGGELFKKVMKGKLKEDIARRCFQQLICAVNFCHRKGVYHRDLKPENLLLDENGNLKITDFGLSAFSESKRRDGLLHTTCGTPAYVAPEVISRKGYDGIKADVWSCGVILFVLLAGYLPFQDPNIIEMYKKISNGDYKCPNWFPSEVRRLIRRILDTNPHSRISIAKIMGSSWFKKGFDPKNLTPKSESKEHGSGSLDGDAYFVPYENSIVVTAEMKSEKTKLTNLNAFDIISLSKGLDLSGLFIGNDQKDEVQFISRKSASDIISKLEDIAGNLKLKTKKNQGGFLKLEGSNEGMNDLLCFDVGVFEIAPFFHLVELKMSAGDVLEFQKMLKQDIKPALAEIVCVWQDEQLE